MAMRENTMIDHLLEKAHPGVRGDKQMEAARARLRPQLENLSHDALIARYKREFPRRNPSASGARSASYSGYAPIR